MPSEDAIARFSRRAAELRVLARQVEDPVKRDGYIAAAETYESLAAWNVQPFLITRNYD
jgi:hypothetical protein